MFTWSVELGMPEPGIAKRTQSVQLVRTCLLWNQSKMLALWLQPVLNKSRTISKKNWGNHFFRIGYLGVMQYNNVPFESILLKLEQFILSTWSKVPEKLELDITMQNLNVPFERIYCLSNQLKMWVPLLQPVLRNRM